MDIATGARKECPARFVLIGEVDWSYSLSVANAGSGTGKVEAAPVDGPGACTGIYSPGMEITLYAYQDSGSVYSYWSGDCSGTDQSTTLTIDGQKTCSSSFDI